MTVLYKKKKRWCFKANFNKPFIWLRNLTFSFGSVFITSLFDWKCFGKQNNGKDITMLIIPKMRKPNHHAPIQRGSLVVMVTSEINIINLFFMGEQLKHLGESHFSFMLKYVENWLRRTKELYKDSCMQILVTWHTCYVKIGWG